MDGIRFVSQTPALGTVIDQSIVLAVLLTIVSGGLSAVDLLPALCSVKLVSHKPYI